MTALSNQSDLLTNKLKETENLLIIYCDGVQVDVAMSNTLNLGVGKVNNEWCLYVEATGVTGQRTRLTSAPRHCRVEAVGALESLLIRIKDKREIFADAVMAATRELESFNARVQRELDAEE